MSQDRYTLTVKDDLSKFLIAVPLVDQTAEQVVKAFVDHVVLGSVAVAALGQADILSKRKRM